MEKEKPESSIPDVLYWSVWSTDESDKEGQCEVEQDIVFVGTISDVLRKYGAASEVKCLH